ncbi:Uu.00g054520.m01.CDS01 [Anthostomella pinea]|uniref:Uu.00g054520.m01.CDS01 n=1 Tax=Anthostomella pinea TaxID=933095 RepID=A0AAI8YM87_9PEZI|nr:Uu.00g054520.m01.CDS01 [Anthostomella pinea]
MGAIKNAFARLPAIRPTMATSNFAYQELPTTPSRLHDVSPLVGSPIMSEAWRNQGLKAHRRLGSLIRTSPKRLFVVALVFVFSIVVLVGGSVQVRRRNDAAKKVVEEPPRIPYHWEAYPRLNGVYNGIRSLVKYVDWLPEQQATPDSKIEVHDAPPLDPEVVDPYPDYSSAKYLKNHHPVQRCYLDENETYAAPDIYAYPGVPASMTAPYWGAYEIFGVKPDRCFERFGRFGPYGYSYGRAEEGLGLSNHLAHSGADKIQDVIHKVDYRNVNWGKAQEICYEKNRKRFESEETTMEGTEGEKKKTLKRTAYVLRTWTGYKYSDIQLLSLRAMINELALKSGGEYDVHLLVHVKDDRIPIWASEEIYNKTLRANVPKELWDIATLWSEQMMRTYYPGPFLKKDNVANHAGSDIYGVYRTAHFALQWFAQQHREYDFFWNWEMDIRYSGHYYEFLEGVSKWGAEQPRKFLWERSARFWIPGIHGSWPKFSVQVEREAAESKEEPVWGPVRFDTGKYDMLPSPNETRPPTSFEADDYEWGVGEDADLITFDPLFDPAKTNWVFNNDATGYDTEVPMPPRRAAIVTVARISRRMLDTMHEETWRMHHTMFPEMWPPTVALHHGFKAVYAPHPVYFDRKWPLDVMDQVFNRPTTPEESPFGWGEHNMQGSTFYYNAGFSGAVWRRWLGAREKGEGGREDEEAGSGRMCLRGLLHHPVKHERVE